MRGRDLYSYRYLVPGRGGDICPKGRFVIWWMPYPSADEAFSQPCRRLLFLGETRLRADFKNACCRKQHMQRPSISFSMSIQSPDNSSIHEVLAPNLLLLSSRLYIPQTRNKGPPNIRVSERAVRAEDLDRCGFWCVRMDESENRLGFFLQGSAESGCQEPHPLSSVLWEQTSAVK